MGRPSSFFSMVLSRTEEGGEGARGPPLMGGRGGWQFRAAVGFQGERAGLLPQAS